MTNCNDCPFKGCVTVQPKLPSKQYDIVIVSESPHMHDIDSNTLLTGADGHVLRKAVNEVLMTGGGKLPSSVSGIYITSAIKCLPPKLEKSDSRMSIALASCQEQLFKQIQMAAPKVLFVMGNAALRSVLQDDSVKVNSILGTVPLSRFGPVIPSLAPAAVEHVPKSYPIFLKAVEHLVKFVEEGRHLGPGITRYKALSREEVSKWIGDLAKQDEISLDIETQGFDWRNRSAINIGISWTKNKAIVVGEEDFDLLGPLFDSSVKQIWQNGKFDAHFLRFRYGLNAKVHEDTILQHYLLDEAIGSHDLEQLAQRYLGAEPYEHFVRQYLDSEWGYRYAPREALDMYLAKDVDYTLQLHNIFRREIAADEGLERVYTQLLIPGSEFLLNLEETGIMVDKERLKEVKAEYEELITKAEAAIDEIASRLWDPTTYQKETGSKTAPQTFNPGSPKQLKWMVYNKLKLKSSSRRAKQDTNEKTLHTLVPKHPLLQAILHYRGLKKMYGTYIVGIEERIKADGRIRSTYKLFGTVTGRLSSTDPNMQNIPRTGPIKSMFIAPPGHIMIEADYSGAELRVLAVASGDENMRRVFIEGRDLHDETTRAIHGPNFTEEQRVKDGKAVNFGIMYGMQADSLADKIGKSRQEAARYLDMWAQAYPDAWKFIQHNRQLVHSHREVRGITGRKRRFHLIPKHLRNAFENEATNFPIQGPASDCTLRAGIDLQPILRERFNAHICNIVHDALYVYAPDDPDILPELLRCMHDIMTQTPTWLLKTDVPFEVDFKIGTRWSEMKKVKYKELVR